MQTALRDTWHVSSFWLWIIMANDYMLHKRLFKLHMLSVSCQFSLTAGFSKNSAHSRCISLKQVKWYCSQMLLFDALNLLALGLFRSTSSQLFMQVFLLFELSFCTFGVVKCFGIKFMMNWVHFCLFRILEWFSSIVDPIFLCLFDDEPWFLININVQVSCNDRHYCCNKLSVSIGFSGRFISVW